MLTLKPPGPNEASARYIAHCLNIATIIARSLDCASPETLCAINLYIVATGADRGEDATPTPTKGNW